MFTITQKIPYSKTINLHPSASGCSTQWIPTPDDMPVSCSNWCWVRDDLESSYVSTSILAKRTDKYNIDSSSDLGTINYVNINTKVKSVDYTLEPSGYVNALLDDGTCSNTLTYSLAITQSFNTQVSLVNPNTRNENPFTDVAWAWGNFTDLQIGIEGSSPTLEVTVETILLPNGDSDIIMSDTSYEPGTTPHYAKVNDYPYNETDYAYRLSSLGYVTQASVTGSTNNGEGDIEVSSNNIIHVLTDRYLQAFTFTEATNTLTLKDTVTLDGDGGNYGNSISVISDATDDYVLVAYNQNYKLAGYSYCVATETYTLEDTDTDASGNYQDSCQDGTYHYVTNNKTAAELKTVEFPNASNNITIKDTQVIPDYFMTANVCTDETYVYTVVKKSGGHASVTAYSIAGNGVITVQDTAIKTDYQYRDPYMACIDIGSETLIFTNSYDGEYMSIWSYNHSGTMTWEGFRTYLGTNDAMAHTGRRMCFSEGGKYYYATADNTGKILVYEIDTTTPDLSLVGIRQIPTDRHENGDSGLTGLARHTFNNRGIFFSNSANLYAYQLKDYFDYFDFENISSLGTVENIEVKFVVNSKGDNNLYRAWIKSGASTASTTINFSGNYYSLQSCIFTTDPSTSSPWLEAGINNLIAGVEIIPNSLTSDIGDIYNTTLVYIQVNHKKILSPEIQVTRQYLTVGYTPTATSCDLNTPKTVSANHIRNIKMLNFWDGDRKVYDYNRSGKSLVLKGVEYENSACDKITSIGNMAENGAIITLSELSFEPWNGEYRIRSFGWKRISKKPDTWEWVLELEDSSIKEEC